MVDNIKDVFRVIWQYRGSGFLLVLYVIALIYLFITEKDKRNRFLVCYLPLTLLLIYLSPVYYRIYVLGIDAVGTYYRNLWMIPVAVTVVYAGCRAISAHRRAGALIVAAAIALCGRFTYTAVESVRAENAYHIPQYVCDLCDEMSQDIEGVEVYACVPLEMLFYVRQYDSSICLLYGREAVEPVWGYYDRYYEAYELAETLNWDEVLELTRSPERGIGVVTYFVVPESRDMDSDPESHGLVRITNNNGYILYKDEVASEQIREVLRGTLYVE
ncbi:MAG: hypothetical protein IKS16_09075 [Lachnospiraceae bacterium]|nr:hypothetical protein [Lachnospiraceae bacterium]